jgi:drug/metabolite transporter (DMT)-like permease
LGERISPARLAGMVLAFAGVGVIFSDKLSIPGPKAWLGDIMTLVAGVLWAATTLVIKKSRLATARPEKVLLYQLATSVVIAGPLLAFTGPLVRDATPLAIGSILFQAFYVVAFTYLVWFWLVTRYPASGLSSFTFLTPAFSVLMGALLLGEPLTWKLGLALLLIATGIVLVNRPARYQGVPNA